MKRHAWKPLMAIPLFVLLLAAVSCAVAPQGGGASRWDQSVSKVEDTLNQALAAYERGDQATAKELASDAYFDVFESSGMEPAIRLGISSRRNSEVEFAFADVRRLIASGAKPAEVRQAVATLMAMLREDAARLGGSGQRSAAADFGTSFVIIVREGFEAILVIGAIIAYVVKSGNGGKVRTIYQSALIAILASIATAVVIRYLLAVSGASRELLEGATMLLAVGVLFTVSFWLLGKVQAQRWQQYIQGKLGQSLTTGSTLALWSAVFLAVYREGAETVLFYQALVFEPEANIGAIGLGLGAGVVVLAAIFMAIRWGSLRLPIKSFFLGTGILLYYMAFVFAGGGIKELQAAGIVSMTPVPGFSAVDMIGVYPTWEGIVLQSVLLLAAGIGLAYQFLYKPRSSPAKARTTV